ncbi:MAG: hypothetical protein IT562_02595, partial [Alphaproteobacteria bacterium]|nr:hypothetical protein [Alphaproteobacteria bacterium]
MRSRHLLLLLVSLLAAAPADAQVGVQFGGGSHRGGSVLFGGRPDRGGMVLEPARPSEMRVCEQEYGQRAIDACSIALGRDRNNAKAHRLLADAYMAVGRPDIALNEYNEALRLDSDMDEAKRGREMAQRYLAGNQPPPPGAAAQGGNPYAAQSAPPPPAPPPPVAMAAPAPAPAAVPRPVPPAPAAQPVAAATGPQDGEWSGRMQRQCTGFSDEGASSVMVSGNQFSGVFFSGGGGRDLRGTIQPDGTVEASGKDTAGNPVVVKGRMLSAQTLVAEGYALNCKMVLTLGRGGAPVAVPSAMAAAAAPVPAGVPANNPFDGEWSGTLTPRGGHYVVTAKVVDGKMTIEQERMGAKIVANGDVESTGQTALRGFAGDAATRGDNMEIKGAFSGNMFIGQGRVGDKWAEMKLTRSGPPAAAPPRPATAVAQATPVAQPAAPTPAPAQSLAAAATPVAAKESPPAPKNAAAPAPAAAPPKTVAAAEPAPAPPKPATPAAPTKTQTATTVAPSPAPMVDKQPPA